VEAYCTKCRTKREIVGEIPVLPVVGRQAHVASAQFVAQMYIEWEGQKPIKVWFHQTRNLDKKSVQGN